VNVDGNTGVLEDGVVGVTQAIIPTVTWHTKEYKRDYIQQFHHILIDKVNQWKLYYTMMRI
jgi:hypothetical protein